MKKISIKHPVIIIIITGLCFLLLCASFFVWLSFQPYRNFTFQMLSWDVVETPGKDRFYYPKEWSLKEGECGYAFFDENGELLMFQIKEDNTGNYHNDYIAESKFDFDGFYMPEEITEVKVLQGDKEFTKRGIIFISNDGNGTREFIVWSDQVSDELLEKFIMSYQFYYSDTPVTNGGCIVENAVIDYGVSTIHSKEDLEAAVEWIKRELKETTSEEIELVALQYAGDEISEENLAYCQYLSDDDGPETISCAVFWATFEMMDSDDNPVQEDWVWYLVKDESGQWWTVNSEPNP